jgi:sugar lactone lactonase YvrE
MRQMLATCIALVFLAASTSYAENPLEVIEVFEDSIPTPAGMALTPDGDLLVVSRDDTSQIFKIDLERGENKGVTRIASRRDLCNSRHLAVDSNGYIYVDTSRPTKLAHTRSDGFSTQQISWVGMFQISPDGKKIMRIEGIDDDTMGLAVDPDGNLFACTSEVPLDQQDMMSKFAEKSAERMFSSSEATKPRIIKFKLGDDSALDDRSNVINNMDVSPAGMAFNSEGDLFFVGGGVVLKVHFGIFGPGKPKVFATLPTAKAKATRPLGICADSNDNLYVSVTNPYRLASGTIFKVNPKGEVTTLAKGMSNPTDCITDSEGNIYFSDLKAEKVFQIPAEALHLEGPFRMKKPPPPVVPPAAKPIAADAPETRTKKKQPAPPVVESERDVTRMTYPELKDALASINEELREKQALSYPDTIVLRGGREIKCEIVTDTEAAIFANMSTGSASIPRSRIELVVYATGKEKEQALQVKSEIRELELQRGKIRSRMRELKPPTERRTRQKQYEDEEEFDSRTRRREYEGEEE